jgi:hypothetical protein
MFRNEITTPPDNRRRAGSESPCRSPDGDFMVEQTASSHGDSKTGSPRLKTPQVRCRKPLQHRVVAATGKASPVAQAISVRRSTPSCNGSNHQANEQGCGNDEWVLHHHPDYEDDRGLKHKDDGSPEPEHDPTVAW